MIIGVSIIDAIDWSQDLLEGTRPEAERALFSLMKDKLVVETERGFEYPDDEDREKVLHNITKAKRTGLTSFKVGLRHAGRQYSKRANIHAQKLAQKRRYDTERRVKGDDQSDEADDMIDADIKNS
jgi:hypothetical protein